MKKKIIFVTVILLLLTLALPYVYVEIMTAVHYNETKDLYLNLNMLSSDNYHKVIKYSKDEIKILSCEPTVVLLCTFTRDLNNEWTCDDYKKVFTRGSLTEADFYPVYPTKHLILPQESKDNFKRYECLFRDFAEKKGLQFSVALADNEIDRKISLVKDNGEIIISLYNDYNGLSGCETVEITYFSFDDFDLSLFIEIQNICMHETIGENECAKFFESKENYDFANKEVKEKFPDNIGVKSKDIIGNGEYVISYVKTSNENIIHLKGLTKRD